MEWVLVFVVVGVLVCAYILGRRHAAPAEVPAFQPTNELERLLDVAARTLETSPELIKTLLESRLIAARRKDAPDRPMTSSFEFPPEFAVGDECRRSSDGQIKRGPFILCFSSQEVVDNMAKDEVMAIMVKTFPMGEFGGRQLMDVAVKEKAILAVNPYFGTRPIDASLVGTKFSVPEMQSMLAYGRMPI